MINKMEFLTSEYGIIASETGKVLSDDEVFTSLAEHTILTTMSSIWCALIVGFLDP
jgi:hypothetical protein